MPPSDPEIAWPRFARRRLTGRICWLLIALHLSYSLSLRAQAPAAQRAPAQDVQKLEQTASAALGQGDYPAAVQALKTLVEIDPRLIGAWFNLGYAYSSLKQNEQAARPRAYLQKLA